MDSEGRQGLSEGRTLITVPICDLDSSGKPVLRNRVRGTVLLVLVLLISTMLAWFIASAVCRNEKGDNGCAALGSIVPFI